MLHPAPWQLIIDGVGVAIYCAEKKIIKSIPHSAPEKISLWSRIVEAINAKEHSGGSVA